MNQLPLAKRTQIINLLVEGNSLRATARICDVSRNTVDKLLVEVGKACMQFHDEKVINVKSKRCQCDEIWSFCGAKEKNATDEMKEKGWGDVWTWTALDADSKLIVSWYDGDRTANSANIFMQEVAGRLSNRVQLTTDGHKPYLDAVEDAFNGQVDFATLIKIYGTSEGSGSEKRYSPAECIGAEKKKILGNPDPDKFNRCLEKGLNVIEQNLNEGLYNFTDHSFDVVVMTQTLQAMHHPDRVLEETLRVGKQSIVAFPNFGHWSCRFYLGTKGRMPVSKFMPYMWYDTPNIHFCTVRDFEALLKERDIRILNRVVTNPSAKLGGLPNLWPNLFGSTAIYHLSK